MVSRKTAMKHTKLTKSMSLGHSILKRFWFALGLLQSNDGQNNEIFDMLDKVVKGEEKLV
jgi:hypothetical protein